MSDDTRFGYADDTHAINSCPENLPRPPESSIEAASRAIPDVLANVIPLQSNGEVSLLASALVDDLKTRGHSLQSAWWAIHILAERRLLLARPAYDEIPSLISIAGRPELPGLKADDLRIKVAGGGYAVRDIPDSGPTPLKSFRVIATKELWEWRNTFSAPGSDTDNPFNRQAYSQLLSRLTGKVHRCKATLEMYRPRKREDAAALTAALGTLSSETVAFIKQHVAFEIQRLQKLRSPRASHPFSVELEHEVQQRLAKICSQFSFSGMQPVLQAFRTARAEYDVEVQALSFVGESTRDKIPKDARTPVVFISSTIEDLGEYRRTASKAVSRARLSPRMKEYFAASGDKPPLAKCLEEITGSATNLPADVLVVLIAHRCGWIPDDQSGSEKKSITWLECEEAHRTGREVLAFVLRRDCPWPPDMIDIEPLARDCLSRFKAWIGNIGIRAEFTTPESLEVEVMAALHEWKARRFESS